MRPISFCPLVFGLFFGVASWQITAVSIQPNTSNEKRQPAKKTKASRFVPYGGLRVKSKGGIWKPPKGYEMFKAMTSRDKTLAIHAMHEFYGKGEETIERLLEIVKSRKTPDGKKVSEEHRARCMDFLCSHFRAPQAVKLLVKMLTYRPKDYFPSYNVDSSNTASPYQYYPATAGLAEIGQPAVRRLLYLIINKRTTSFERKLAVWALLRIEYAGHSEYVDDESDASIKRAVTWRLKDLGKGPRIDEAVAFVKSYKLQIGAPEKVRGFLPKTRRKTNK